MSKNITGWIWVLGKSVQWKPLFTWGIKCSVHLWKPKKSAQRGPYVSYRHKWNHIYACMVNIPWNRMTFASNNGFIKSMYYVTQDTISNLVVLSLATSVRFCISSSGKITFLISLLVSNHFSSTYSMIDNLLFV